MSDTPTTPEEPDVEIPTSADYFPCETLVEIVTDYLEGTLPEDLRARIDHHLVLCPGCQSVVDQVREVVRITGRLAARDVETMDTDSRALLMDTFRAAHRDA